MTEPEGDAWDALFDTDAARCCSCPSCNFYAPDYEQHKDEPCIITTLVNRIADARAIEAPATVAWLERAVAALRGIGDDETADYLIRNFRDAEAKE